jgi:hypothetical protein
MKTLKFLLPLLAVIVVSCSSDDPTPDVREQAMGTYNYTMKFYYLNGTALNVLPGISDEVGTFIATKTELGFEVKEGGDLVYRGTKVASATNGFSFDIESQTVDIDGDTYTITGYDGVSLSSSGGSSTKYNGGYFTSTKKLDAYFKFNIPTTNGTVTAVIYVTATKV